MFERFFRGDRRRSLPGSGLGLSLVQAFVHAHRGTVLLHADALRGNTFEVRLPYTFAPHAAG